MELIVRAGANVGAKYAVPRDKDRVVLGRWSGTDIQILDRQASRSHAEIVAQGDALRLRDLKSRNGTQLNNRRISYDTELKPGDRIRIGETVLELVVGPTEASGPAAAPKPPVPHVPIAQTPITEVPMARIRGTPAPSTQTTSERRRGLAASLSRGPEVLAAMAAVAAVLLVAAAIVVPRYVTPGTRDGKRPAGAAAARVGASRHAAGMGIIKVSADGRGFVDGLTGKRFVPFGLSYGMTGAGQEVWQQSDVGRVERDCRQMKAMGANVFRVFLLAASSLPEEGVTSEEALAKTDALFEIARRCRLRVILSGPDQREARGALRHAVADGSSAFADERSIGDREGLWRVIARRYRDEPALFAYSLGNEPHVPWQLPVEMWRGFLKEKYGSPERLSSAWRAELAGWDDVAAPQDEDSENDPALYDYQLFREHLARRWVERQVKAIRSSDDVHMITHSGIQWDVPLYRKWPPRPGGYSGFEIRNIAAHLDYVSIYWYGNRPDNMSEAQYRPLGLAHLEEVLAHVSVGKPVIQEECSVRLATDPDHFGLVRRYCAGCLFREYGDVIDKETHELNPGVASSLLNARAQLEGSRPEAVADPPRTWRMDRRRLLTWYGGTLRENPAWARTTGRTRWNDTGGHWTDTFRKEWAGGEDPVRIELFDPVGDPTRKTD